MQTTTRIRIKENEAGDAWVIEQDGGRIVAPFPLTNAVYGSEEYEAAAEATAADFLRAYIAGMQCKTVPPALLELARCIAERTASIPDMPVRRVNLFPK